MHREIHIWRIEARDDAIPPESSLRPEELDTMQRFHAPLHGRRWGCFRSGLRQILSRYLDVAPIDIDFQEGEYGKPALKTRPEVHFNLSHSGAQGLLAVTRLAPIGIDVEQQRPLPAMDDVINQWFTSGERAAILELPPEQREAAFYNQWTCKEAVMKASGMGLQMPPGRLHIDCPTPGDWQAIRAPAAAEPDRHFLLTGLETGPGYKGAVALEIADQTSFEAPRLHYFDSAPGIASLQETSANWPDSSSFTREKAIVESA